MATESESTCKCEYCEKEVRRVIELDLDWTYIRLVCPECYGLIDFDNEEFR